MKHHSLIKKMAAFSLALCCSLSTTGCSINFKQLFENPDEMNERLHANPLFWETATLVEGDDNLYKIENPYFANKPYNDMAYFGDNLLLIGLASYSDIKSTADAIVDDIADGLDNLNEDEETNDFPDEDFEDDDYEFDENPDDYTFEYSFEVYSPWADDVIYTLDHDDITCDSYMVVGDYLFLNDSENEVLSIYNTELELVGTYSLTALQSASFYSFCPTKTDMQFLTVNERGSLLKVTFEESTYSIETVALPYYDITIEKQSPNWKTLVLRGVNKETFRNETFLFDVTTEQVMSSYNTCSTLTGGCSNSGYMFQFDWSNDLWSMVMEEQNQSYFKKDDCFLAYFAGSHFILATEDYEKDSETNSHQITYHQYDFNGNGLDQFTFDSEALDGPDRRYICNNLVYLKDSKCVFFLTYNSNCEPYLLAWKNLKEKGPTPTEDITFYTDEIDLYANEIDDSESDDPSQAYDYGNTITLIPDPASYDWAEYEPLQERINELEETYGLEIYFGPEVPDLIATYQVDQLLDYDEISFSIDKLETLLEYYPTNFFSQLVYGDFKGIRIYIGSTLSAISSTDVTSPGAFVCACNNHLVMVLDADYSYAWESTLNHEISHLIDQRLAFRSYYVKDAVYNEETWNSYNPEAFSYSYTYVGYETSTLYDAFSDYFVSSYSTTYPTEDRAEIFGLAMDSYLLDYPADAFEESSPIRAKHEYYCDSIRDGFDTTDWPKTTPWEEVLSN